MEMMRVAMRAVILGGFRAVTFTLAIDEHHILLQLVNNSD